MKLPKFGSLLVVGLCLISCLSLSARDLNSWQLFKDSLNQQNTKAESTAPGLTNWPSYDGFQQTGKIDASFGCFGMFGQVFLANYPSSWTGNGNPPGFRTPADSGSNYLWAGAIWVGGVVGTDTLVSVGFDGQFAINEFTPPYYRTPLQKGGVSKVDYAGDYALRAAFTDTTYAAAHPINNIGIIHTPLKLKVAIKSVSWHTSPANNCILYDLVITNVGEETIRDGSVGFYYDGDVGDNATHEVFLDDLSGSIRDKGIGYLIDNNGDLDSNYIPCSKIFAFKILGDSFNAKDTSFNWWINSSFNFDYDSLDFGPRQRGTLDKPFRDFGTGGIGTPVGDTNKYYVMKFPEWDYDQIYTYSIGDNDPLWLPPNPAIAADYSDGNDARFLMSISTFQLPPDSSIRVLYSNFTGDFVHTTGGDANYLPRFPDIFMSLIYFDNVIANAHIADSLSQFLLNPNLPALGLEMVKKPNNSVELQWDPWVYDDVTGYKIFISEANLDLLPHPGVIPPWWGPDLSEAPANVGRTYRMAIDSLDPDTHYLAAIAHKFGSSTGQISSPINFKFNLRELAPEPPGHHAFVNPGGPLHLIWHTPDKSTADHFNIYKFPDLNSTEKAYHSFYDEGYFSQFFQPKDSVTIGAKKYFYYAMQPYAVAGGNDTLFLDPIATEGEVYLIASADEHGFESEFSKPIFANVVDPMTRDILLITNSPVVTPNNYTFRDSIYSFYNRILQGFDYEIYSNRDSTNISNCPSQDIKCMDWHDFMRFKMVIVDDHLSEAFFSKEYEDSTEGFVRYLAYGGKVAYFGHFRAFGFTNPNGFLNYFPIDNKFVEENFGIDSLMFGGERFYNNNSTPPYLDTLFGFVRAQQTDGSMPSIGIDSTRDPFTPRLRTLWTPKTPPGVATFKINENAEVVQLFESAYPSKSLQQEHIVGVRRNFPELNTNAYAFGFHLWYMDSSDARELIDAIFEAPPAPFSAQTSIVPNHFSIFEANAIDPGHANIYVGNLSHNRLVNDINLATIKVNSTVLPTSAELIPVQSGFAGEVLKIEVPIRDFLLTYGTVWDTLYGSYNVTADFNDGQSLQTGGTVKIFGHRRGDINSDQLVNISDLTFLVDHLFRGRPLPEFSEPADVNHDGHINVLDLTKLVDYIFRGGKL